MGSIWLHDLPDVLTDAGVRVRLWDGWETRARSSGGYDAVYAVFAHHTASKTAPDNDCSYMWNGSPDRPVGAVLLDRTGLVTIGAAGATNCQGKGGPWTLSTGTIPLDKGNAYGVAIEAANNGIGEGWPTAQVDAYVFTVAAMCEAWGLDPNRDVLAHFEWVEPSCPGRKVDPVGPSPWATGASSWDMDGFRGDVAAWCDTGNQPQPPEPEPEPEDDVTDDDVERIAEAVWRRMITDPVNGDATHAATLLTRIRTDANNARTDEDDTAEAVWKRLIRDPAVGDETMAATLITRIRQDTSRG